MSDASGHFFDHEETYPPPPTGEAVSDVAPAPVVPGHQVASTYDASQAAHFAPATGGVPLAAPNHEVPDVEALLLEAIEMIETARPAPLSTAIKIEGEPLLDRLYDARERLPDELRAARWLLRDREEYLESQRIEGEEIIALARSRAERLVERTEVVRSAEQRAQRILSEAKAEARQMRRETEDFCDARLASLEGILNRTSSVVATGRARLQGADSIDLTTGGAQASQASDQYGADAYSGDAYSAEQHAAIQHSAADESSAGHAPAHAPAQRSVDLFDQDLT